MDLITATNETTESIFETTDKKKKYYKKWYDDNREKQVVKLKEKVICECGRTYSYVNKTSHLKTKIHMDFVNKKNENIADIDYEGLILKFYDLVKATESKPEYIAICDNLKQIDKLYDTIKTDILKLLHPNLFNKTNDTILIEKVIPENIEIKNETTHYTNIL